MKMSLYVPITGLSWLADASLCASYFCYLFHPETLLSFLTEHKLSSYFVRVILCKTSSSHKFAATVLELY